MTDKELMQQALEALENTTPTGFNMESDKRFYAAITALRERLAQPEQEFTKHEEGGDGWSEWVCPDPDDYLIKCCDCGLVHEAQFRVVKYAPAPSEECEIVNDPNLQAVFRMRRSQRWTPDDTAYRPGGMAQPEQEIDWKDQYEKQKRRAEMWRDKYEAVSGPDECVYPAQPEQEPVAHSIVAGALFDFMGWLTSRDERLVLSRVNEAGPAVVAIQDFAMMRNLNLDDAKVQEWQTLLAPAPRQWVGLTDEEIEQACVPLGAAMLSFTEVARAIEAKLREKNGGAA